MRAQGIDDALLVAGELEVDVELDARVGVGGEVREALLERQRVAAVGGAVVVGEHEAPAAVAVLGQHVELDHVDPGRERGVEARQRVARSDEVGALVPDALHRWHPAHQNVGRLSSHWPRCWIFPPQRGQVMSRRL